MRFGSGKTYARAGRFCLSVALLLIASAGPARAVAENALEGPVTIVADRLTYDKEKEAFYAEGDVAITFTGGSLKADEVVFYRETSESCAQGHVLLRSDQDYLAAEKGNFNFARKTGVLYRGKMFIAENHIYLEGEKIEKKGEATYRIESAAATTCDDPMPDWRLTGREVEVTIDGYGVLRDGKFLVKNTPVLYIPYFIFPALKTRQSGVLLPYLAYSRDKNGFDIEVPVYWAISRSADATFYQRYMENRGFKEGAEFRYALREKSFGTFYADYLEDHRSESETTDGLTRSWDSQKRWSYYFNHESSLAERWFFRADIWRISDPWYFKDFSSHNYYLDHYVGRDDSPFNSVPIRANHSLPFLESKARLVKNWDLSNLTVLGRYTDNLAVMSNDETLQEYPEIAFTVSEHPLFGSPVHASLGATYDYYYREQGQRGHLLEVEPFLSLPLTLTGTLQLTPFLGIRESVWDSEHAGTADTDEDDRGDHGSRGVYHAGANLSMAVHRIFSVNGTTVEKIRHEIKPELIYAYIADADEDVLPDYAAPSVSRNGITYALTNTLVARLNGEDGNPVYREMLRFKLSQTYDIEEARRDSDRSEPERRPFGDIDMELDVTPLQQCRLRARNRYNVNSGVWEQMNYDLHLRDEKGNAATLEYRYTRELIEEVNLHLRAALTNKFDAMYRIEKNINDHKTVEHSVGVRFHKQCWAVELNYSDSANDRTLSVSVSLLGLGKNGGS